jgi:hypothetical protein
MLNGEFTLRFACLAFRTHLKTVDTLLEVLKVARVRSPRVNKGYRNTDSTGALTYVRATDTPALTSEVI